MFIEIEPRDETKGDFVVGCAVLSCVRFERK